MPEETAPTWWELLETAEEQRKEMQEILDGPEPLSADELGYLAEVLECVNETVALAREKLGLTD